MNQGQTHTLRTNYNVQAVNLIDDLLQGWGISGPRATTFSVARGSIQKNLSI